MYLLYLHVLYLFPGYYVHLSTMAEVREQVLQYVPVMARPMVLGKSVHPVIWTPVYADVTVSLFRHHFSNNSLEFTYVRNDSSLMVSRYYSTTAARYA